MPRKINCLFINVNSLVSKHRRHYLNLFLKHHNPDMVLIAEHKLNFRHQIHFKNYNFIRNNHVEGKGGGTAICIRGKFYYKKIALNLNQIENAAIKVILIDGSAISFVAMYIKPAGLLSSHDPNKISNVISTDKFVLGGDLNLNHGACRNSFTNRNGKILADWLISQPQAQIIPTKFPTRISSSDSLIDIFITSAFFNIEFNDLHPIF